MVALSKRGLRAILWAAAITFLAAAAAGGAGFLSTAKALKNLAIDQVDLSQVKDGEYEGFYDGGLVKARVRVKVSGHQITELTLLQHEHGLGRKAESIVHAVVQAQSLAVDTVSGATGSSKVILKAVELALKQGITTE
ncbi:MAG: FMN-binding protein [Bacillota bacterium]|nr:FMN-binding protein [Bacillota bacterium]